MIRSSNYNSNLDQTVTSRPSHAVHLAITKGLRKDARYKDKLGSLLDV